MAGLALMFCVSAGGASLVRAQVVDGDLVRVFDGEELRDPTRPAGAVPPEQADGEDGDRPGGGVRNRQYQVSFIRAGGSQPMAVINGQSVRVGDEISGARVLSIETGVVALDVNGERRTFSTWRGGAAVREPASIETTDTETMNRE